MPRKQGKRVLDPGLREVLNAIRQRRRENRPISSKMQLAQNLGISRQALTNWSKVPPEHCLKIESLLGIPRETLRWDIYGDLSKKKDK